MRSTFILLALALCIIILLCVENIIPIPFTTEWSSSIQAIAVIGALVVSLLALVYAKKEYDHHKKSEQTSLLCQYLNRYVNSETIQKVTEYIIETALLDEKENIIGFDNSKKPQDAPSIREKELFMHFFEEIQLHIDNNMIDANVAKELLGYYAGIFHKYEGFHQGISDYENEKYWRLYLKFVRSIPDSFLS